MLLHSWQRKGKPHVRRNQYWKPARQSAEKLQLVIEDLFGLTLMFQTVSLPKQLKKWLKKVVPKVFFRLLHRASRDGIGSDVFHSKCDNEV